MAPQLIGFAASIVLLVTLASQVWKQWSSGRSDGVSPWLFIGQAIANVGMLAYSILLGDVVFIVTNSATLVTSCVGFAVQAHHARRAAAAKESGRSAAQTAGVTKSWRATVATWQRIEATVGEPARFLHVLQLGATAQNGERGLEAPPLRLVTDESTG